jgi:AraC-like DNA-binding protein
MRTQMDLLSNFFENIHLSGHFFYGGKLLGAYDLDKPPGTTFIHIISEGGIDLVREGYSNIAVNKPSVLLCPITCKYKLRSNKFSGSNVITASFHFGEQMGQTFPLGIHETIIFELSELINAGSVIEAIIDEFNQRGSGRSKALNSLFEYVLILLIRNAVENDKIHKGVLFAMLKTKLAPALNAIHESPEFDWTIDKLAYLVNMSRTKFSELFLGSVGVSPIAYLTSWRMKCAQEMLLQEVQIKVIASSVGYNSQAAFTRAFLREFGQPPSEWSATTKASNISN